MQPWKDLAISHIKEIVLEMPEEVRIEACRELRTDSRKGVVSFADKTL